MDEDAVDAEVDEEVDDEVDEEVEDVDVAGLTMLTRSAGVLPPANTVVDFKSAPCSAVPLPPRGPHTSAEVSESSPQGRLSSTSPASPSKEIARSTAAEAATALPAGPAAPRSISCVVDCGEAVAVVAVVVEAWDVAGDDALCELNDDPRDAFPRWRDRGVQRRASCSGEDVCTLPLLPRSGRTTTSSDARYVGVERRRHSSIAVVDAPRAPSGTVPTTTALKSGPEKDERELRELEDADPRRLDDRTGTPFPLLTISPLSPPPTPPLGPLGPLDSEVLPMSNPRRSGSRADPKRLPIFVWGTSRAVPSGEPQERPERVRPWNGSNRDGEAA